MQPHGGDPSRSPGRARGEARDARARPQNGRRRGRRQDRAALIDRAEVERWLERYADAWRRRDAEAAVALFTEDCRFRSHPFRGAEDVREYTRKCFQEEEDVAPRFGRPVVEGDRAAVEYWAAMREDGLDLTLAGCIVMTFALDGRCAELRDVWATAPERLEPPADWGR